MFKLEGLYQLPMGFDISFTFNARAGHIIPHYMTVVDYAWTNSRLPVPSRLISMSSATTTLPTFYQLNLRLEKMIKLGDTGRIYLMADAFNVTNTAVINRRYDMNEGTYYIYTDGIDQFAALCPQLHGQRDPEPLHHAVRRPLPVLS